ncbi:hypothetical protein Ssi03_53760 [Sphaerisporangium siamense]|uniref:Uncharacterized protein n=1 Tax=Sphaerisporangium siamense TaxID=795645 RepID=A0A7W7GBR0_9ACTN|nr:hypothetical protein [Sphaerisporangium siamense]MBB4701246.1 hypothetical protein [Sphaerisporangium siamense]GII87386.1 hypothetical protein Ssi03_53760 [Sphaerisporangium siamense]
MNEADRMIDRLVADIAPDPGPGMTPLARELLDEITMARPAAPARPRRRWLAVPLVAGPLRRWSAVPVAAALAMIAMVAGVALTSPPASAALEFKREKRFYVITVKDLFANPGVYQAEFEARGFDITLSVAPTSEGNARSMFVLNGVDRVTGRAYADGAITTIMTPGPCLRRMQCAAKVKVPVDYRGTAEIVLGRVARPGEEYELPPPIDGPGEPFHCVRYVNKTVADLMPMLRARGVMPEFFSYGAKAPKPAAPLGWYVHDGVMSAAGKARILVQPTPNPTPRPFEVLCPNGP